MINIKALKIVVKNGEEKFGKELIFNNNFEIINAENSKGKSTCINSILYGLGLEELLGDRNRKAMKSVLREELIVNGVNYKVDESFLYVEISNGKESITIKRYIKHKEIKPELVKVIRSGILTNKIDESEIEYNYMYVHSSGSAQSEIGFHKYLEEFIGWDLPSVNSFGDKELKLYLQTIFSGIFIEQVKGWSDFMATVPTYFGIKDVKKRVIEFILDMDVMKNMLKKQQYDEQLKEIEKSWANNYNKLTEKLDRYNVLQLYIPSRPQKIKEGNKENDIFIILNKEERVNINKYIKYLENEYKIMNRNMTPKVKDNYDHNYLMLNIYEDKINILNETKQQGQKEYSLELFKFNSMENRIKSLNDELKNYDEIRKLSKLGAMIDTHVCKNLCPTCNQKLSDTLLEYGQQENVMTLEENIDYLKNEIEMLKIVNNNTKKSLKKKIGELIQLDDEIYSLLKNVKILKNELFQYDELPSEVFITKKLDYKNKIENYQNVLGEFRENVKVFENLYEKWFNVQEKLSEFPKDLYSSRDEDKIKDLLNFFKINIIDFGYESKDINRFVISNEKGYVPTILGVNLKMDNSSSDFIRAIWAYTLALFQVSSKYNCNHPGVIIFDEPGQQQMKDKSFKSLLKKVSVIKNLQCIIGTSFDEKKLIQYSEEINFSVNHINEKAIG